MKKQGDKFNSKLKSNTNDSNNSGKKGRNTESVNRNHDMTNSKTDYMRNNNNQNRLDY